MDRRLKILFTIPNFDTAGSGRVLYDLVKGLDKRYFEPEICCNHDRGEFFKVVEQLGVKIHLFPVATGYRPFLTFPSRVWRGSRFFKKHQFDLVHSWHWSSDITEPLSARLAGIPFVYTKKAMGWGNRSWIWRSQLSSRIIAVNTEMAARFFSKLSNKVDLIPFGIETSVFGSDSSDELGRDDLGLKPSDFVVITVANLVPIKGIETLIEATMRLKDPSVKVLIVGDDSTDYAKLLKADFSSPEILFVGKQLNVKPYLRLSDLFVLPTKEIGEGMPVALLEAMASGLLVLGSDVSGNADLLQAFPKHLFIPQDIDDLANKITAMRALSGEKRQALELEIRNIARCNYSMDQFINRHEALYNQLVK